VGSAAAGHDRTFRRKVNIIMHRHMRFPTAPKCVTLSNLEVLFSAKIRLLCQQNNISSQCIMAPVYLY